MRAVRNAMRRLIQIGLTGGWLLLGLGLALHLTVRDGHDALATLFYGLPLPVLAGIAAGLTLCTSQQLHARLLAGLICLTITSVWASRSIRWNTPAPDSASDLKVLVWNLARPDEPSEKLVALIRDHQPDIASIVEPGASAGDHIPWYEERLPGYQIAWMPRGILWFSRLPSRYRSRGKLDGLGAYAWFEVQHPKGSFRFVSVDVYPNPFRSRSGQLQEALAWAASEPHAILAGDFNTPPDSVHFDEYRLTLTDAFSSAGRGFRETWFWGIPLLPLDQIWCGPEWTPRSVEKIHTMTSDHAALLATLTRAPRSSVQTRDQTDEAQP